MYAAICSNWLTHLVQHHITDWREPFRLLYAGRHELEAQQEVPVILTLSTRLCQVCTIKKCLRWKERNKDAN